MDDDFDDGPRGPQAIDHRLAPTRAGKATPVQVRTGKPIHKASLAVV